MAINGGLNGKYESFDIRGGRQLSCVYRANVLHGPMTRYNPFGDIIQAQNFDGGVLHGPMETYENGKLISKMTYVNGAISGIANAYGIDGKPVSDFTSTYLSQN